MMLSTLSLLLVLSAPQAFPAATSPHELQTATAAVDPPPLEEDQESWNRDLQLLLEIICVILNCNTISEPTALQAGTTFSVQRWVTTHQLGGLNPFITAAELVDARAKLHAMDIMAANDPGVLPEPLRAEFRQSIASILEEIGE
jgi:hypothetical protein